jgi:hypothetical protein
MFMDSPEVFEMGYSGFLYQGNGEGGRKKDHLSKIQVVLRGFNNYLFKSTR